MESKVENPSCADILNQLQSEYDELKSKHYHLTLRMESAKKDIQIANQCNNYLQDTCENQEFIIKNCELLISRRNKSMNWLYAYLIILHLFLIIKFAIL